MFSRCLIPERIMRALLIVFDFPPMGGFAFFVQVVNQVQIGHCLTIGFIEALNVSIPVRFTGLNINWIVIP